MASPPTPTPGSLSLPVLADYYAERTQRIRQNFEVAGEGAAVLRDRSDLVDSLVVRLYSELISADPQQPRSLSLVALGGYGRHELFPHSDIDLLFLTEDENMQTLHRDGISTLLRMLAVAFWVAMPGAPLAGAPVPSTARPAAKAPPVVTSAATLNGEVPEKLICPAVLSNTAYTPCAFICPLMASTSC